MNLVSVKNNIVDCLYKIRNGEVDHYGIYKLSPIKSFINDPQTFQEWVVNYLYENKDEITKRLSLEIGGSGVKKTSKIAVLSYIMSNFVYPYVSTKLFFNVPETQRLERGAFRDHLDVFVDEALWEMFQDVKKYYSVGGNKYYCIKPDNNKYKETLIEVNSYGNDCRTLWILLEQEGLKFEKDTISLQEVILEIEKVLNKRFVRKVEEENESSIGPREIFSDVGYYLYRATALNILQDCEFDPRNEVNNEALIDELIWAFSNIRMNSEVQEVVEFMPSFQELPEVRTSLLNYFGFKRITGGFNAKLAKYLFSEFNFVKVKKRALRKFRFTSEIKALYDVLDMITKLHFIGLTYYNQGKSDKQKLLGELLLELSFLYADRIEKLGVEIEIKLKIDSVEVLELFEYQKELQWLVNGENVNEIEYLLGQL